jgi:hypothetical protein
LPKGDRDGLRFRLQRQCNMLDLNGISGKERLLGFELSTPLGLSSS